MKLSEIESTPGAKYEVYDRRDGRKVGGPYSTRQRARSVRDKKDLEYGAVRYGIREVQPQLNELSTDMLSNYARKAAKINPNDTMGQTAKHTAGSMQAIGKIAAKTGDKTPRYAQTKANVFTECIDDYFTEFLTETFAKYNFNEDDFSKILAAQHEEKPKPKREVVTIDYHGWAIKYRKAGAPGDKVDWVIYDKKQNEIGRGVAVNDTEAVRAAQDTVKQKSGSGNPITQSHITVDFNSSFTREFMPDSGGFFANIDFDGTPVLLLSNTAEIGLKKVHPGREPKNATTKMYSISLSGKEANNAKLVPGGRYVIGDKISDDGSLSMYNLIFAGQAQSPTDKQRLGVPGLTVARAA